MPILYRKKLKVHTSILPELNGDRLDGEVGFLINDEAEVAAEEFEDSPMSTCKIWVSVLFGSEDDSMLDDRIVDFDEAGVELFERHLKQCRKNGFSNPERINEDWCGVICWMECCDNYCIFNKIYCNGFRKLSLWIKETDVDTLFNAIKEGLEVYRKLQKERLETQPNRR